MSIGGMYYLLTQLGHSAPSLVVSVVAFVLAIAHRKRAPRASTLTLAGVGVLVIGTLAGIAGQAYLVHSMVTGQGGGGNSQLLGIAVFAATCVRAVGLFLLVLAIFAGRGPSVRQQREREASREDDEPRRSKGEDGGLFREGRGP